MNKTLLKRGSFNLPADYCTWAIDYDDGTSYAEAEGGYAGIDRNKFKTFKLMSPDGQVLFETWPPDGASGQNFVFRRRTSMANGQRSKVVFVFGFEPMGPAFAVDVNDSSWRSLPTFTVGDSDLYPVAPMPGELGT